MYKKIAKNDIIIRKITDVHSVDNYLTKETTENISLAINRLDGKFETIVVNSPTFCIIKEN